MWELDSQGRPLFCYPVYSLSEICCFSKGSVPLPGDLGHLSVAGHLLKASSDMFFPSVRSSTLPWNLQAWPASAFRVSTSPGLHPLGARLRVHRCSARLRSGGGADGRARGLRASGPQGLGAGRAVFEGKPLSLLFGLGTMKEHRRHVFWGRFRRKKERCTPAQNYQENKQFLPMVMEGFGPVASRQSGSFSHCLSC